ncbi:MAG: hypothetical protein CMH50_02490 [Myxococcales bacterium]|nr:hypothetical protein [Myxococcales bacterium]
MQDSMQQIQLNYLYLLVFIILMELIKKLIMIMVMQHQVIGILQYQIHIGIYLGIMAVLLVVHQALHYLIL